MRVSDWSSDVCSSDLRVRRVDEPTELQAGDYVVALATVAPLAFTVFYRRELPQMVALAAAVAGHERAEDLAQEALLRAHREWDRIGRYDKPGAWTRREIGRASCRERVCQDV